MHRPVRRQSRGDRKEAHVQDNRVGDGRLADRRPRPAVRARPRQARQAKLVVVHAREIIVGRGGGYPVLADESELRTEIHRQVDELQGGRHRRDVHRPDVRGGPRGPDGRRGRQRSRSGPDRRRHARLRPSCQRILGSTTQGLLHAGVCPVLAVPTGPPRAIAERELEPPRRRSPRSCGKAAARHREGADAAAPCRARCSSHNVGADEYQAEPRRRRDPPRRIHAAPARAGTQRRRGPHFVLRTAVAAEPLPPLPRDPPRRRRARRARARPGLGRPRRTRRLPRRHGRPRADRRARRVRTTSRPARPPRSRSRSRTSCRDAVRRRGCSNSLRSRAGEVGIESFVAEVLPENSAMLAVFRDAGFEISRALEGGEVEVRFPIASDDDVPRSASRSETTSPSPHPSAPSSRRRASP